MPWVVSLWGAAPPTVALLSLLLVVVCQSGSAGYEFPLPWRLELWFNRALSSRHMLVRISKLHEISVSKVNPR